MNIMKPLIVQLTKMVKEGYDLGKKELPKTAQELLTYALWTEWAQIIMASFLFICLTRVALFFADVAIKGPTSRWNDESWGPTVLMSFAVICVGVFLGIHIDKLLKIKLAPRVYLLETLNKYING